MLWFEAIIFNWSKWRWKYKDSCMHDRIPPVLHYYPDPILPKWDELKTFFEYVGWLSAAVINLHELVSYNGLFPYVHSPSMRITKSELFMVLGRVIYSCNCGGCIAICHFSDMILQDKLLSLFESFYPFSLGHFVLLHDWFSKDIGEVEGHICCWGSAATVAFCLVGLSHVSPHDRLSKLNIVFHNMAWCHSRLSSGHGVYKPVWCGLGGKVSKLTPTGVVVRSTTRRFQARK